MTFAGWFTVVLTAGLFALMVATSVPVDAAFLGGTVLLLLSGTLSVKEALSGFASPVVVTVGALFVVTAGLRATGIFRFVLRHLLGTPKSRPRALLKLILPVAALSAFMSNTLVVSVFAPIVGRWARRLGVAPSKLLIPLSYAAGMGGMCLLIGTPANLVISQFFAESAGTPLGFCAPLVPGLCVIAWGTLVMTLFGGLLPARKTAAEELEHTAPTCALKVRRGNHLVGLTLAEADIPLENGACRLAGIVSFDGEMNARPTADTFLMGRDTLFYTGAPQEIAEIARRCDFECAEPLDGIEAQRFGPRTFLALAVFVAMVAVSIITPVPLVVCCLGAAFAMVVSGCCTVGAAKKSLNWDVLLVFAGSIVLGKAIDRSGLASAAAHLVLGWCGTDPLLALALLCVFALALTEFVSNTACGAVLAPIAAQFAAVLGTSPLPFFVALMVCCSSSYLTPISSPTHLIVYVPGGYRFTDFLRLGVPMSLGSLAIAVFLVPRLFPF